MVRRLRDDLLSRLLLPMATILFVSGILSYRLALRSANRSYDRSLAEGARALSRIVKADQDGHFELPQAALQMQGPGEGDRAFFQIRSQQREALAGEIVAAVVAPPLALIFFAVAVAVAVIVGGITSGLHPLVTLAQTITQRRRDDLAPLPSATVPGEAVPLIDAFNGLLGRLAEVLVAQQRFVADAAHQLRTPLAGLKIQIDNACANRTTKAGNGYRTPCNVATISVSTVTTFRRRCSATASCRVK